MPVPNPHRPAPNNRKSQAMKPGFSVYPRSESNRDRQNRNLKFYPLNYRGIPG